MKRVDSSLSDQTLLFINHSTDASPSLTAGITGFLSLDIQHIVPLGKDLNSGGIFFFLSDQSN